VKQVDHGAAHAFPPSPKNADNSSHWLLISTRSSSSKYGLLLLTAGMSDICTAHEGQYTSSVPQVRIHNPPHLSQYFSSKRTISKPSISMIASVAITWLSSAQMKRPCADCSVTGPVYLTENLLRLFS
jgi:hypothetical protein